MTLKIMKKKILSQKHKKNEKVSILIKKMFLLHFYTKVNKKVSFFNIKKSVIRNEKRFVQNDVFFLKFL